MFKEHPVSRYFKFSAIAALLYSIVALIYIRSHHFDWYYILYIGNFLFGCSIGWLILVYRKPWQFVNRVRLIAAGHITAVIGILLSGAICGILLLVYASGRIPQFSATGPGRLTTTYNGNLASGLFLNAVFGNIGFASFFSMVLPFITGREPVE